MSVVDVGFFFLEGERLRSGGVSFRGWIEASGRSGEARKNTEGDGMVIVSAICCNNAEGDARLQTAILGNVWRSLVQNHSLIRKDDHTYTVIL